MRDVVADTGYSNGYNYAVLEQGGLTPWIPVFGAYKPEVEGFTYHAQTDEYRCRADKPLPFRKYRPTLDGHWMKIYRACYADCQACPHKANCCAPLLTPRIGAPGTASAREQASACAECGSARWNPSLATYSSIMACGGSARKGGQRLIKQCWSVRLLTTLRNCSSTSLSGS
jgi:hypothetical protein